jgi:hypothetical protein
VLIGIWYIVVLWNTNEWMLEPNEIHMPRYRFNYCKTTVADSVGGRKYAPSPWKLLNELFLIMKNIQMIKKNQIAFMFCQMFLTQSNFNIQTQRMDTRSYFGQTGTSPVTYIIICNIRVTNIRPSLINVVCLLGIIWF